MWNWARRRLQIRAPRSLCRSDWNNEDLMDTNGQMLSFSELNFSHTRTVGVILGDFPSFVMFSIFILILIGQVLFSGGSLHLFIHVFLFIRIIWCLWFLCHETVVWKMHKWSWSSVLYVKDVHKLVTWRKHGSTGNTLFFNLIHLTYLFIFAAICKTGRCRITVLWWCLAISCGSGQNLAWNRNKNELLRRCCCQFK